MHGAGTGATDSIYHVASHGDDIDPICVISVRRFSVYEDPLPYKPHARIKFEKPGGDIIDDKNQAPYMH